MERPRWFLSLKMTAVWPALANALLFQLTRLTGKDSCNGMPFIWIVSCVMH